MSIDFLIIDDTIEVPSEGEEAAEESLFADVSRRYLRAVSGRQYAEEYIPQIQMMQIVRTENKIDSHLPLLRPTYEANAAILRKLANKAASSSSSKWS